MNIKKIQDTSVNEVIGALCKALHTSRFTAEVETPAKGRIKIRTIRLREKKHYCGNHPSACEGPDFPHKRLDYLEGADWVEFDDLVNDVLDSLGASASVDTGICILRKGAMRRLRYREAPRNSSFGNAQWEKDEYHPGQWADYRGKTGAPRSTFPKGTPGIYTAIGYACVG